MKKNAGFTLIEILSVVVILGIIMLIAVPSVSEYIKGTRKETYATDARAYIESAKSAVTMKDFGSYPLPGQLLLIPVAELSLEKNNTLKSPFAPYVLSNSYIVVEPESVDSKGVVSFNYYAVFEDTSGYQIPYVFEKKLSRNAVVLRTADIVPLDILLDGSSNLQFVSASRDDNSGLYEKVETRGENNTAILMRKIS